MASDTKKRILNSLLLAAAVVVTLFLVMPFVVFPNRAALIELNRKCRGLKPGVTLGELIRLFGAPKIHENRYQFGSAEYFLLFSDHIVARLDARQAVTSLRCGEGQQLW